MPENSTSSRVREVQDDLKSRELENEIFHADFPHERTGLEAVDKYMLRDWLIGYAVRHGWKWTTEERMSGVLKKAHVEVVVELIPVGLKLSNERGSEVIATKL